MWCSQPPKNTCELNSNVHSISFVFHQNIRFCNTKLAWSDYSVVMFRPWLVIETSWSWFYTEKGHKLCFFTFCLFRRALLESPLSWEEYAEKFHLLLYLEELQMEVDIKKYNIPNSDKEEYAVMKKDLHNKKLLILEVNMCSCH